MYVHLRQMVKLRLLSIFDIRAYGIVWIRGARRVESTASGSMIAKQKVALPERSKMSSHLYLRTESPHHRSRGTPNYYQEQYSGEKIKKMDCSECKGGALTDAMLI